MFVHGYAEILRNVLACRGIKSIYIESKNERHAFNQVNLGGKWYYVDLTWDKDNISRFRITTNCLLSKKKFQNCDDHRPYKYQEVYQSDESFNKSQHLQEMLRVFIPNATLSKLENMRSIFKSRVREKAADRENEQR